VDVDCCPASAIADSEILERASAPSDELASSLVQEKRAISIRTHIGARIKILSISKPSPDFFKYIEVIF
jgi:hypothetical protein